MSDQSENQEHEASGFIVVTVLWMLAGLSALVSIYAAFVVQSAAGLSVHDDQLRSRAMASAAIELTAYRQLSLPANSRATGGRFNFRLGVAEASVVFQTETARIDINAAPAVLLAGLFKELGASQAAADHYAERVVAWRSPASATQDREQERYRASGYVPRGSKFPHVNELALVQGLPRQLIERSASFLTVYSGRAEVNVFEAPPSIIAALPGITRGQVSAVLAQRTAPLEVQKRLLQELDLAQRLATADGSRAIRIAVEVNLDNGFRSLSEVVILLNDQGSEPFSILSWDDGIKTVYR